jgi:hypothetical protein
MTQTTFQTPTATSVAPLLPVVGADLQAPLVTGGQVRYANLDYAAQRASTVVGGSTGQRGAAPTTPACTGAPGTPRR